jgi:hypothetical protein
MNRNGAVVPLRGTLADIPRGKQTIRIGARRKAMTISAIVALAAVVIIVSSIALAPSTKQAATPPTPAKTQAPKPIINAVGYTYDALGNKMGGVAVNITDLRTGEFINTTVSGTSGAALGFYIVDVNNSLTSGVLPKDRMNITAYSGSLRGYNETNLPDTTNFLLFFWLNVTLNHTAVVIPEFGSILAPMVGMFGIVAVVSFVAGRKKQ